MPYLIQKRGFKGSAAIFRTKAEAIRDAEIFYPDVPYRITEITEQEAQKRQQQYQKRLQKYGRNPSMITPSRVFNGNKLWMTYSSPYKYREDAQKYAKAFRTRGYIARVTKEADGYCVWTDRR